MPTNSTFRVLNLSAVGRYIGGNPETAPLHKLGGEQWMQVPSDAPGKEAYDVATELLEVQALQTGAEPGFRLTVRPMMVTMPSPHRLPV